MFLNAVCHIQHWHYKHITLTHMSSLQMTNAAIPYATEYHNLQWKRTLQCIKKSKPSV
jgi:hypothetical protein